MRMRGQASSRFVTRSFRTAILCNELTLRTPVLFQILTDYKSRLRTNTIPSNYSNLFRRSQIDIYFIRQ